MNGGGAGSKYGRGRPSHNQGSRVSAPENFEILCAKWGKIALCFDSTQTEILTQTFGNKWFSEVASLFII